MIIRVPLIKNCSSECYETLHFSEQNSIVKFHDDLCHENFIKWNVHHSLCFKRSMCNNYSCDLCLVWKLIQSHFRKAIFVNMGDSQINCLKQKFPHCHRLMTVLNNESVKVLENILATSILLKVPSCYIWMKFSRFVINFRKRWCWLKCHCIR